MPLTQAIEARPKPRERPGSLSVQEEQRLARRWRTLDDADALARLVESHMGLVVNIAQQFRRSGPSLDDLIQEGHVGLVVAARRFDPKQGTRLSTYASYWIRAYMMDHVVRSHGPVRIGTTRAQRRIYFGMGRARRTLERTGQPVTTEALAEALGVEQSDVESMAPRLSAHDLSLDGPRGAHDDRSAGDLLVDDGAVPETEFGERQEVAQRAARLRASLKVLDARERAIIRARHLTDEPETLGVIGARLGVSRERVRQLELRALKKMQRVCRPEVDPDEPLAASPID